MERYRPGRGSNLVSRAPCLYPGCRRIVDERPAGGGHPRSFCGSDCRANFHNIQHQLDRLIGELQRVLRDDAMDDERLAAVGRDLERARWHRARFRPLEVFE